jgi:ATP-dependent DNA helicase RecG
MDTFTLINTIALGESSTVQFKRTFEDIEKITPEIAAFLNTNGGKIIIGVDNDKSIYGIDADKEDKLLQWLGSASSEQHLNPPASIIIEKHLLEGKMIIVVDVPNGVNKPYQTKSKNLIYVKNAADKRIASVEELRRMMQSSSQIHSDEAPVVNTSIHDLDVLVVDKLIVRKLKKRILEKNEFALVDEQTYTSLPLIGIPYKSLLENIGFLVNDCLTLSGLLIACPYPQKFKPQFAIHCIKINGTKLTSNEFIDKESPFTGNLEKMFEQAMSFIDRNIKKIQVGDSINSYPEWQVPKQVFEELIVNALLHRDYFINASIRIIMFDDRIEIISPGKLPNSQNIEKIKTSSHVPRNPILASNGDLLLPYIGIGTGIPRIFDLYPKIELIDDREKELFIAVIKLSA